MIFDHMIQHYLIHAWWNWLWGSWKNIYSKV